MYRVGAIDIDTSHPVEFAKIMNNSDRAAYTCVFNSGVRSDDYVKKFMKDNDIDKYCDSLEQMIGQVDIVFIHGCNWDKHVKQAELFLNEGIPVFIDKPIAGNFSHCQKLKSMIAKGGKVIGGSSFRYCQEFLDLQNQLIKENENIFSIIGSIGVDEFNYGIHVIESIGSFFPKGANAVKCLSENSNMICNRIFYDDDQFAVYQLYPGIWRPTSLLITTNKSTYFLQPDITKLYEAILSRTFDTLDGKFQWPNIDELLESIEIALAAKLSIESGKERIQLSQLSENEVSYNGAEFEKYYANQVN